MELIQSRELVWRTVSVAHRGLHVCPHVSVGPMKQGALRVSVGVGGPWHVLEPGRCFWMSVFGNARR